MYYKAVEERDAALAEAARLRHFIEDLKKEVADTEADPMDTFDLIKAWIVKFELTR